LSRAFPYLSKITRCPHVFYSNTAGANFSLVNNIVKTEKIINCYRDNLRVIVSRIPTWTVYLN